MPKLELFESGISDFLDLVRSFVCDDLGCECPIQVFEQIRILRGEASPGKTDLALIIGERLLVLFSDYEKITPFEYEMPRLLLAGITYRDSIGLNRCRIVFNSQVPDKHRSLIEKELAKYDDKLSVHYID